MCSCHGFSRSAPQQVCLGRRTNNIGGNVYSWRRRPQSGKSSAVRMKVSVGIVGLPNVGKSTLFNSLARKSIAQAANFPFCTIDPNIAQIAVRDDFLEKLGALAGSKRHVPATMEWVDVAGLAKGASRGEGLGNRFLATVRECTAICHLVRTFEDPDIIHVDGTVDPVMDAETINLELVLADLAHVERRLEKKGCIGEERETLEQISTGLQEGIPARTLSLSTSQLFSIKSMGLLTLKPMLYAFNVDEVDFTFGRAEASANARKLMESIGFCDPRSDMFTIVSAQFESEVASMSKGEQNEYMESLGFEEKRGQEVDNLLSCSVLPPMIQRLLDLSFVYTGPGVPPERSQTTRAHLFNRQTAIELASRLHGDIERGFICAEVTKAPVLLQHEDYLSAKKSGAVVTEGREYCLESNDVVLIKWKKQ